MYNSNFYSFCLVATVLLLGSIVRLIKISGRTITVSAICTDVQTRTHAQHYRKVRYYRPLFIYSLDGVQMTGSPLYFSKLYHLTASVACEIKVLKRKPTQVVTKQDFMYAMTPALFALALLLINAYIDFQNMGIIYHLIYPE